MIKYLLISIFVVIIGCNNNSSIPTIGNDISTSNDDILKIIIDCGSTLGDTATMYYSGDNIKIKSIDTVDVRFGSFVKIKCKSKTKYSYTTDESDYIHYKDSFIVDYNKNYYDVGSKKLCLMSFIISKSIEKGKASMSFRIISGGFAGYKELPADDTCYVTQIRCLKGDVVRYGISLGPRANYEKLYNAKDTTIHLIYK